MINRVSSTNKEKQTKRKNRTKKQRLNRKTTTTTKNGTKKLKMWRCRESNPVHLQVQATL